MTGLLRRRTPVPELERVGPLDRYLAEWRLTGTRPLVGEVAVAFTAIGRRAPTTEEAWHPGVWADEDAAQFVRICQLAVAGSVAAEDGDTHPGPGIFDVHLRYREAGLVRVLPGGRLGFE
jgi:hypothetical protein